MEYTSSSEASSSCQRLCYCERPMVVKTTQTEHNFGRRLNEIVVTLNGLILSCVRNVKGLELGFGDGTKNCYHKQNGVKAWLKLKSAR
ncbi:hypothetical protein FH972_002494 [Carpinus fangiana]|uniref:Uncharacterized protein n=1 Tax=Carpinus fangiana TaxID=176857 RepID=A0A5N6QHD5_9ROSI|nr:hypothetical protein FH972_002494 [Carpinus fangiana]